MYVSYYDFLAMIIQNFWRREPAGYNGNKLGLLGTKPERNIHMRQDFSAGWPLPRLFFVHDPRKPPNLEPPHHHPALSVILCMHNSLPSIIFSRLTVFHPPNHQ